MNKEQAGDTTMDEAIGLLKWALEILKRDERPEVESWRDQTEDFIGDNE